MSFYLKMYTYTNILVMSMVVYILKVLKSFEELRETDIKGSPLTIRLKIVVSN